MQVQTNFSNQQKLFLKGTQPEEHSHRGLKKKLQLFAMSQYPIIACSY